MGFFNKLKKNNDKMDDYELFSHWLDNVLERKLPQGIIAFNFNLYEGNSRTYDVQLIGSNEFDDDDGDWACTDYFSTGENICCI